MQFTPQYLSKRLLKITAGQRLHTDRTNQTLHCSLQTVGPKRETIRVKALTVKPRIGGCDKFVGEIELADADAVRNFTGTSMDQGDWRTLSQSAPLPFEFQPPPVSASLIPRLSALICG